MSGQNQIGRSSNMRPASMADLPAALVHMRVPGVILLARDVKRLVNLVADAVNRRSGLTNKPQRLKSD